MNVFFDDFNEGLLNESIWMPTYLPQWSSRAETIPSYRIKNSILTLFISNGQKPWSTEWNNDVRVSNLQTGVFSGDVGSDLGQHHFAQGLIVREYQGRQFKLIQKYGVVEFKARCNISKENVAAFWLIGVEEEEHQSAEICLFELKGVNISKTSAKIGFGVHPFKDPGIVDEFFERDFDIDVTVWNTYGLDWDKDKITFYINGKQTGVINQSPNYPMQLMLSLYDLEYVLNENNIFEIDYIKINL